MWGEAGPNCRRGNAEGIGRAGGAEPESGSATAPTPRLAASRVIWGEGDAPPCPSAPCGAVATQAEDPCPRSDAAAPSTGSSPGAPGLPAGNSCRGSPGGCSGSGAPRGRWETPKWGSPMGGGGNTGRAAGGVPGSVGSCSGAHLRLAPGIRTAGAAPAESGDSPPAEERAPRSPRRRPRGPLPPEPQPGLQPPKVWRHGTATGGCAGPAGSAGSRGGATAGAGPERSGGLRSGSGAAEGTRAGCGGGCGRTYLLRRRLPALGGAPSPEAR